MKYNALARKNIKWTAQTFYDLRSLTGYCSVPELSDFFERVGCGKAPEGSKDMSSDYFHLPPDVYDMATDRIQLYEATASYSCKETAQYLRRDLSDGYRIDRALRRAVLFDEERAWGNRTC